VGDRLERTRAAGAHLVMTQPLYSVGQVEAMLAEARRRFGPRGLPVPLLLGVLPLVFKDGMSLADLKLQGGEIINIAGLGDLKPRQDVIVDITYADGTSREVPVLCRIDTEDEMSYYRHGGILPYVLRNLAAA
jgi:aconitate hydratase